MEVFSFVEDIECDVQQVEYIAQKLAAQMGANAAIMQQHLRNDATPRVGRVKMGWYIHLPEA